MTHRLRLPALLAILLLGWGLRFYGLPTLHIYGDSAYSIYYAAKDLLTITHDRIYDGHPPLHYYLLHFLGLLAGFNPAAMRWPSIAADMLTCCLLYRFGADLWRSQWIGFCAALLWAISPFALYYGHMPRMYALMALLCLLALYLFYRAFERGRYKDWLAFGAATLAALFTQYYAIWLVAVVLVFSLVAGRLVETQAEPQNYSRLGFMSRFQPLRSGLFDWRAIIHDPSRRALLVTLAVVGLLYLPWVLYAFVSSATTTAGIISNAPPPVGIPGYLEQVVVPQIAGVLAPVETARLMLAGALPALVGLLLFWHRSQGNIAERRIATFTLLWWIVPVGIVLLIFLRYPYLARQRFFLFITPAAYLLLSAGIATLAKRQRWQAVLALAALLGSMLYGTITTLQVEPGIMEADAVQLTQRLEADAQPGDALILHAFWQGGNLLANYHGTALSVYALQEVTPEQVETIAGQHRRIWLSMYNTAERDPQYPLEQLLDQGMAKLATYTYGPTRLALYVAPYPAAETGPSIEVVDQSGQAVFALSPAEIGPPSVHAGEQFSVSWIWKALQTTATRYTTYLHLQDAAGRTWAGRDSEPESGVVPTMNWQPGESHRDVRGLQVPADVPPGNYTIVLGIYDTGSGNRSARLRAGTGSGLQQELAIGTLTVTQAVGIRPAHPLQVDFGDRYTLAGYSLPALDQPSVITTTAYTGLIDVPVTRTIFKTAYTPGEPVQVSLFWSANDSPAPGYSVFVHLEDADGRVVAQTDQPLASDKPGLVLPAFYTLQLPANIPPGEYRLVTGIYNPASGQRLELPPDLRGRRANAYLLHTLQVQLSGVAER